MGFPPKFLRRWWVLRQGKKALEKLGLPKAFVEGVMGGWKTWTAGLLQIVTGLGLILETIKDDEFSFAAIKEGIALIGLGLGMIGVGHKLEKGPKPQ